MKLDKQKIVNIVSTIVIISFVFIVYKSYHMVSYVEKDTAVITNDNYHKDYDSCMVDSSMEISQSILDLENDLTAYLNNYNVGLYYEDLTTGLFYGYNETQSFYEASLVKLPDAIYTFENNVNLNQTVTYSAEYNCGTNYYFKNKTYGDTVSIHDLICFRSWCRIYHHHLLDVRTYCILIPFLFFFRSWCRIYRLFLQYFHNICRYLQNGYF